MQIGPGASGSPFPPVTKIGARRAWSDPNRLYDPGRGPGGTSAPPSGVPAPLANLPSGATPVIDPYHFANIIDANLTVGTTSVQFLQANSSLRNFLMFRSPAANANNLFIGFGKDASTLSTLSLVPGAIVVFDEVVSQQDLYVIADGAGVAFCFAYSTYGG